MLNTTLINATTALINITNTTLNATSSKSAFLNNLLNPVFLASILPILLVVALIIFVVKNAIPVSHFLYANARIQARTSYMVKDPLLLELTDAKSLKEFSSLLRETTYGEELEKSKRELRTFHIALERGFINSILELVELSPKKSQPLLDAHLMFLEVKMLKIIYRARLMEEKIDQSLVYNIGTIDENLLKHLLDTQTIADISTVMAPTIYAKIFEKEYSSLEEFEVAIDEFVFNNFVDIIKKTRMYEGKYIIDILNKKIDISNILALLKFRIRNVEKEKQKAFLIDNKTELGLRFDKLINSETLKDFVESFKNLSYHEPLTKALEKYEKDNVMYHFENELYRFFKIFVVSNDLSHTLGPYPLFSYLIKKELELRNLFIISRGIEANFPAKKIKEMIV